jgi:major inositol transporter-like SP family MFS transporter
MFIAELAPAALRGQLVTHNELMIVTGQMLAYTSNAVIANFWPGEHAWRYMLGLASLPAVLLFFGMLFVPESPRWYASKQRFGEVLAVLRRIGHASEAQSEFLEIKQRAEQAATEEKGGWTDLRIPWIRKLVIVGVVFGVTVQLTGVNSIMYFAPTILQATGLGTRASITATMANGVVSVVSVLIGIYLLGKFGRRPMIITSQAGITISLMLLGGCFLLPESTFRSYVVLAVMLVFLFFMQSMIDTVYWLVTSEIFPTRLRGFAMGVAIFAQWISNATVAFTFPILISALSGNTFFILGIINIGTLIFLVKYLPETRGLTSKRWRSSSSTATRTRVVRPSARHDASPVGRYEQSAVPAGPVVRPVGTASFFLQALYQRGTRRPGVQGSPRPGRARDEVRHDLARRCSLGQRRLPRESTGHGT